MNVSPVLAVVWFVALIIISVIGIVALLVGANRVFARKPDRIRSGVMCMLVGAVATACGQSMLGWIMYPHLNVAVAAVVIAACYLCWTAAIAVHDNGWSLKRWKRIPNA